MSIMFVRAVSGCYAAVVGDVVLVVRYEINSEGAILMAMDNPDTVIDILPDRFEGFARR